MQVFSYCSVSLLDNGGVRFPGRLGNEAGTFLPLCSLISLSSLSSRLGKKHNCKLCALQLLGTRPHDAQNHTHSHTLESSLPPPRHELRISKARTLATGPTSRRPFPTRHPQRHPVCAPRPHALSGSAQGPQEQAPSSWGKLTAFGDPPKVGLGRAAGIGRGRGGPVSPHVLLHSWPELAHGRRKRGDGACVLPLAFGQREKGGDQGQRSYLAVGLRGGQAGTGLSAVAPLHADRRGPSEKRGEARAGAGYSSGQAFAPGAFKEKLDANPSPDPRSPRRRPPV